MRKPLIMGLSIGVLAGLLLALSDLGPWAAVLAVAIGATAFWVAENVYPDPNADRSRA